MLDFERVSNSAVLDCVSIFSSEGAREEGRKFSRLISISSSPWWANNRYISEDSFDPLVSMLKFIEY